ncbi:MAG: 2OG-Fe(II) oxygenase [Alphaproteobacteria bacterium]|nr:2OG-Fe(II) oxygenase [Alphaproteobacteria bacterium]
MLQPGEPAPWFAAPTASNPAFQFDTVAGRHIALCFPGPLAAPTGRAVLAAVDAAGEAFDDQNACFFGVAADAGDVAAGLAVDRLPGVRWFHDFDGAVAARYRARLAGGPAHVPHILLLDPALRVVERFDLPGDGARIDAFLAAVRRLPAIAGDAWSVPAAPVLVVPRVFEPELCRRLIDLYETVGGGDSGFMTSRDGKSVGVHDHSRKRRSDCMIEDERLRSVLRSLIHHRLVPMIARGLQFQATRIERYVVACYEGERRGFFTAHRDNTTPATRHRKFAVTINLNAEDYEGGDLRFPEFGRRTYRATTGGAVVFSCSLMHEALPVTRGRRYAFLPFLYDDVAAEVRRETTGLIVDSGGAKAAAG